MGIGDAVKGRRRDDDDHAPIHSKSDMGRVKSEAMVAAKAGQAPHALKAWKTYWNMAQVNGDKAAVKEAEVMMKKTEDWIADVKGATKKGEKLPSGWS